MGGAVREPGTAGRARERDAQNVPDRDSLMAANLDWALTTLMPGAKAVAWAHDVHVAHGGDKEQSFFSGSTMGAELKRRMGGQYQAISLLLLRGRLHRNAEFLRSRDDLRRRRCRGRSGASSGRSIRSHGRREPLGLIVDSRQVGWVG